MTPHSALARRNCDTCGHEFRREASAIDGRVLWFHYGTEAVGPKGDAALCRCLDCQRWKPLAPRFGPGGDPAIMEAALASVHPPEPVARCSCVSAAGAQCLNDAGPSGLCDACHAHVNPAPAVVFS